MKLATLTVGDGVTTAAVIVDAGAVPVNGYEDVGALLQDPDGMSLARAAAQRPDDARPYERTSLRQPVLNPGAVVCVGLNYRNHILEMGHELPSAATLFAKLPRALTDPYAEIVLPAASQKVDHEAELAFVIGVAGRDIAAADAWDHVAGLTVLNDVSMRDYQQRSSQFFAGKTFEACTPWGPWIVTPDEVGDVTEKQISLTVNGEQHQHAKLGDLLFDVPTLVADLSRIVTLEPGDLIATGTPGGVGAATGRFLTAGDTVTVTIEDVGEIVNTFTAAAP
ncbi:MAG: fumarylacetoacetate hydrolase family protein [Solirubrobacteraceae bacterium]